MPRNWKVADRLYLGASIGIVTTLPEYRGRGYGSLLIDRLAYYYHDLGADFLYLQGIPNFYCSLGFQGFAPKSKFVIKCANLPIVRGVTVPLEPSNIQMAKLIYDHHQQAFPARVLRNEHDWQDLIGPLRSTFLFHQPKLIKTEAGDIVGYYCSSPGNPAAIREFITLDDPKAVVAALSILSAEVNLAIHEQIEIFAGSGSVLNKVAAEYFEADFIRFFRPRSSNMVKSLSTRIPGEAHQEAFIFQGDNL
jgi:predicted acetyltransferase